MPGSSIFLKTTSKTSNEPSSVDKFLESVTGRSGGGRLIFALDATASRGPTWDMARGLQGDMIREAASIGRLDLQLVYFCGGSDGPKECSASDWMSDPARLARIMSRVECRAGYTQISRVLAHARRETAKTKVGALVFVGDACEDVEDDPDRLAGEAVQLGQLKTPVFAFQEGRNRTTENAFRKIADLSGGAYGRFDAGGVKQLGDLLRAVASFAAGGLTALAARKDQASVLLLEQLKEKR
jgi:hypothetical protein